jgi:hypothetical protein
MIIHTMQNGLIAVLHGVDDLSAIRALDLMNGSVMASTQNCHGTFSKMTAINDKFSLSNYIYFNRG